MEKIGTWSTGKKSLGTSALKVPFSEYMPDSPSVEIYTGRGLTVSPDTLCIL
jgi:hypothetical protein